MTKIQLHQLIGRALEGSGIQLNNEITGNTRLREDLGFDSLGLATLTVMIEEESNVDIFENGLVSTVEEIYKILGIN